jgi:ketosteroid isomerase-like protein
MWLHSACRLGVIFILAAFLFASCNNGTESFKPVTAKIKDSADIYGAEIDSLIDSIHSAFRKRDFKSIESHLTEDGLYLGTDPDEIWSKQQLSEFFDKHDTLQISYDINASRRFNLSRGSNTEALILEQFYLRNMSRRIGVRAIIGVKREEGRWKVNFYSWSIVLKNEDIGKINEFLSK